MRKFPLLLLLLLALAACSTPATPAPLTDRFPTAQGDLLFQSARLVDEVHVVQAEPGQKILLVRLDRADGAAVDVDAFQQAELAIAIEDGSGASVPSTMGGMIEDGFAIGFMVPADQTRFTLIWPGAAPFELTPTR